jgi:hypothetical protein
MPLPPLETVKRFCMIVKHIPIRKLNKSSFSRLVDYITQAQDKNERVSDLRITNCISEQPAWAVIEAEMVQKQNTRSLVDKTYHLLVSFPAGEQPSPEVLRTVEDRLCESLGYQEHQRVSAVHHDTDHLHIHIAINKVHPTRFTTRQPYRDYKLLADASVKLEQEHNLTADNHIARLTQGQTKAQDMEKAAGIESLIGWIKRGCLPELLAAASWEELHTVLAHHSLALSERGNGLVVTAKNGIAIKASSLSRNFSKQALERRLGVFQPAIAHDHKLVASYEAKPMPSRINTQQLWALYQQERLQHTQRHTVLQERARQRKYRRIESAKKMAQAKRMAIAPTKGRLAKVILHHSVTDSLMKEIHDIQQDYQQDRQNIYAKGRQAVWYDWLKAKAFEGNTQALEVLRHRYERVPVRVNAIGGEAINRMNHHTGAKIEKVTKRGTLHYQIGHTVLRDDGKVLRLSQHINEEVVMAALNMAVQRFGRQLEIAGTEAFRQQALVAGAKLNITFADQKMEQQRMALVLNNTSRILSPEEAALCYIAERNHKCHQGINILPHRHYAESDAGEYPFAGLRQIKGQQLILLETPTEILVLPIGGDMVHRCQRLSIGNMIDVTAHGLLRSRGRRM